MKEKLLIAIKERREVEPVKTSVRRLLKAGDVEVWTQKCCSRIADSGLLDDENVCIDFMDFPDIELNTTGIMVCKDILLNYVPENLLKDVFKYLCAEEEKVISINNCAKSLKDMNAGKLLRTYREARILPDNVKERIREYIQTEIITRYTLPETRMKMKKTLLTVYVKLRHRNIVSILKRAGKQ